MRMMFNKRIFELLKDLVGNATVDGNTTTAYSANSSSEVRSVFDQVETARSISTVWDGQPL
jgi:hypothetical protein